MTTRLDDETLDSLRRLAASGAYSRYLAERFNLSCEQVDFVCGRVSAGKRETYGNHLPAVIEVDERRGDPTVPFSFLPLYTGCPSASAADVVDIWQYRWEQSHRD